MMKEDKSFECFHSHKHHIISLPRGSGAFISSGMIAILLLSCLCFLMPQYQSDLLLASTHTIDHSSVYNTINNIRADPTTYNTVNKIPHPAPTASSSSVLCDLSRGEWVPSRSPPLYTNDTCKYINPGRNCLQNGRPDRGYLHWTWKPSDCELAPFSASHFLKLLRGKKLAFVGDSLAQDQGLALLCALTQVEGAQKDDRGRWFFPSYNFTVANLWSPFLVQYSFEEDDLVSLHLDVPEAAWASHLQEYDIAIISTGYWYFRRSLYYSNKTILGASPDSRLNFTKLDVLCAFRITMGNVLKYIATEYPGVTVLRSVTVDHFENGSWNDGGFCNKTKPFSQQRSVMPLKNSEMNRIQVEEFEKAMALVNGSSKFKLLNVTYSAYLRPDGHPNVYRNQRPDEPPANDCLHWCMPGPIDMWNQLVFHTLQPIFTNSPISESVIK